MKIKILVPANMALAEDPMLQSMIMESALDGNVCAMLGIYSVFRALAAGEMNLVPFAADHPFDDGEIRDFNENCDGVVLPLDLLFAEQSAKELAHVTKLVENLKIPCLMIDANSDAVTKKESYSKEMMDFLQTAWNGSGKILVIGEKAAVLKRMGYIRSRKYVVLDTTDMFVHEWCRTVRKQKSLGTDAKVSIGCSLSDDPYLVDCLFSEAWKYGQFTFLPQMREDYLLLYAGQELSRKKQKLPEGYPTKLTHPVIREGKEAAFVNVAEWLEYISGRDFYVGTDVRGVVAALVMGVPAMFVTTDPAVLCMAGSRCVPCQLIRQGESIRLDTLYEACRPGNWEKRFQKECKKILKSLKRNGFEVPDGSGEPAKAAVQPFRSLLECDLEEQGRRITAYGMYLRNYRNCSGQDEAFTADSVIA